MKNKQDSMSQFLQKQPHSLTMARHTLGIHQLRIMVRIVEQLQPLLPEYDKEKRIYEAVDFSTKHEDVSLKIKVSELVVSGNYTPLRQAIDGIMKKIVRIFHQIPDEGLSCRTVEIGMPMIKKYKYEHGDEFMEVEIGGELLPQLIDLARGYTKYSLQVAFNTSSPNVFKLYQYIAHFRDLAQVQCNVDMLRKWLQLEDKYKEPASLKKWILEPAMKELKEKADVWFDIAGRVEEGRRMVGWKFNIYTKKEVGGSKNSVAFKDPELELKLVTKYGLGKRQVKQLIAWLDNDQEKMRGLRKALYGIQLMMSDGKVQNVGGYTSKVLEEKLGIQF